MDKNVSKQHLTKIWDDLGLSRSDQVHDWKSNVKRNKVAQGKSQQIHLLLFIVVLFILYAVCRQGYSMFDHKSLTLLRQQRENRSMKRHTKSAPYTITHTVCQTGITFVHEWIIFITTDPKREKERAKVGVKGGKKAVSSLASRHFPLLF